MSAMLNLQCSESLAFYVMFILSEKSGKSKSVSRSHFDFPENFFKIFLQKTDKILVSDLNSILLHIFVLIL